MKKKQVVSVVCAVIAGAIAISLAGCGTSDPVHDVPWYKNHDKQRAIMVAKCKADPGELGKAPNCVNAQRAESELLLACNFASDKATYDHDHCTAVLGSPWHSIGDPLEHLVPAKIKPVTP